LKKIMISDFDGTIYGHNRQVNQEVIDLFHDLRKRGIITAIATGRSLFTAKKVIAPSFPIDYLILSSGAGLLNWQTQELLYHSHLSHQDTRTIANRLIEGEIDFMIHDKIPNNHFFDFFRFSAGNTDFHHRIDIYQEYARQAQPDNYIYKESSQLLAVLPPKSDFSFFDQEILESYSIIHATSPLDHQSRWIEIFPKNISKAQTAQLLCNFLNIDQQNVMAVGNDYNDLDLLDWAGSAFIVENAPEEIKPKYYNIPSCHENGIIDAAKIWLKLDKF